MFKSKKGGLERLQRKYAYIFVTPWIFGIALFFIWPLISSIIYVFSDVSIEPGQVVVDFVGLKNLKYLIYTDPGFTSRLGKSIGQMFYSLPLITSFSLIIAVMLNRKFAGRTVFRALFFLPILITSSAVLNLLGGDMLDFQIFSSDGFIDPNNIINNLNIPSAFNKIVSFLLASMSTIIYKSAVQVILFLGGLQNIPDSLYEVSKIEGANKWEEFWLITVPGLRHVMSLIIIYTMIDLFTGTDNVLVENSYNRMTSQDYGNSSAQLWMYFVIIIFFIGIIYYAYNRFCMKKWE